MSLKVQANFKKAGACVCFVLLFLVLFNAVFSVLLDKEQTWYKHRNYTALPQNTVDILYVGNSHFNAAINAALVDEMVSGTFGFNYSVSGMRMDYAYYRLKEALRTQSPRLVVLDTFCLVPLHEGESTGEENVICWSLDGIPLNTDKIAAVNDLVPLENRPAYLVPFIKYHARWEHLTVEDVVGAFDASVYDYFGRAPETTDRAMAHEDEHFTQNLSLITEAAAIDPIHLDYLNRFIALAQENGAQVLLFGTPYRQQFGQNSADGVRVHNYLRGSLVNGETVRLLDTNEHYAAISFTYSDMRDDGHVNLAGAEKTSRFLGDFIRENYGALLGGT